MIHGEIYRQIRLTQFYRRIKSACLSTVSPNKRRATSNIIVVRIMNDLCILHRPISTRSLHMITIVISRILIAM